MSDEWKDSQEPLEPDGSQDVTYHYRYNTREERREAGYVPPERQSGQSAWTGASGLNGGTQSVGNGTSGAGSGTQNAWAGASASGGGTQSAGAASAAADEAPKYAHYQVHQNGEAGGTVPQKKKNRKFSPADGFARKAGAVTVLAVIFGLVAGVVFQAVNLVSDKYLKKETQTQNSIASVQTGNAAGIGNTDTSGTSDAAGAADNAGTADTAGTSASGSQTASQAGTVAYVAQSALPSVVAITSVSMQEIRSVFGYGMEYPTTGSGSGIIVGENDDELLIATNNHVVEGATTLNVCFIGTDVENAEEETQSSAVSGSTTLNIDGAVSAKIKGTDSDNDLAVIAVQKSDIPDATKSEIKIAVIGSSEDLVVGDQVVAIGNALGYGQSVTSGWVSALNRTVTLESGSNAELIQTDAAINPGNSGGALLNMSGELIGINCAKYASSTVEGMGYAIPISKAQPILQELMNRKTRDKVEDSSKLGYLGVTLVDISDDATQMYGVPSGVFVYDVESGGPAEEAGIQVKDILEKLDGQKISSKSEFQEKMQYYAAGEEIEVVVARNNGSEYEDVTLTVTLGTKPDSGY